MNCQHVIRALEEIKSSDPNKLDTELYIDTLKLRGIIKFRMGFALEAIKYLNFARRQEENFSKQEIKLLSNLYASDSESCSSYDD